MKKFKMLLVIAAMVAAVGVSAEERSEASLVLTPGVKAPDFSVKNDKDSLKLSSFKGKYILLQFWANNAEGSLKSCIAMDNAIKKAKNSKIEMVAVSFEPLKMVYDDLVKAFDLKSSNPILVKDGVYSDVYAKYRLYKGLGNYLIDENGVIVAKDLTPENLAMYSKQIK